MEGWNNRFARTGWKTWSADEYQSIFKSTVSCHVGRLESVAMVGVILSRYSVCSRIDQTKEVTTFWIIQIIMIRPCYKVNSVRAIVTLSPACTSSLYSLSTHITSSCFVGRHYVIMISPQGSLCPVCSNYDVMSSSIHYHYLLWHAVDDNAIMTLSPGNPN